MSSTTTGVMHPNHPVRIFMGSFIFFAVMIVLGFLYLGPQAALQVLILGIMEISLSFDNAIVNSKIVSKLSDRWKTIFLTVGVLIAVFGMRLLFPLLIVGVAAHLNPVEAFNLAMQKLPSDDPNSYAYILHEAHPEIASFGGMFLLMLFLDWLFDDERETQWLKWLESPLVKIGKIDLAAVIIGLLGLITISQIAHEHTAAIMVSGVLGMVTYLLVNSVGNYFENKMDEDEEKHTGIAGATKLVGKAAFVSFLYLEVLDASFSFDGVIGAFAISNDPIIIALGLGAGAMFVRSITIYLVNNGTLNDYVFLEHGAHWAIGVLSILLIASIALEIPETITGLSGVALIVASFITSIMYNKKHPEEKHLIAE